MAWLLPMATRPEPLWQLLQCIMETPAGSWRASISLRIRGPWATGDPWEVRKPRSAQIAAWEWTIWKAYLESV